ncbi:hypothetical protein D3C79_977540 [compost metagenome]
MHLQFVVTKMLVAVQRTVQLIQHVGIGGRIVGEIQVILEPLLVLWLAAVEQINEPREVHFPGEWRCIFQTITELSRHPVYRHMRKLIGQIDHDFYR